MTTLLFAAVASAQEGDSEFASYEAYADFVDSQIKGRNFTLLIQQLGGRDEYTKEELAATQRQMEGIWQQEVQNVTVFNRANLGGGIWQEGRIYWTGQSYAYFYALLHQRADALVVINFLLNSSSKPIMDRF
jgi:hypothetical protein